MAWTTPPTFSNGQVLTSTAMNQLVGATGDLPYLYGDVGWTPVGSFTNSWGTVTGAQVPGYRKIGTTVMLRGVVGGGTGGQAAFTLPAGYRAAYSPGYTCWDYTHAVGSYVQVNSSGTVVPYATSTGSGAGNGVDLAVITFSADV